MDKDARILALESKIGVLELRVDDLERQLFKDWHPPVEWGLTPKEAAVVGVLMQRPSASKEAIMMAVYGGGHDDYPGQKIVDVFICKARKKLARFGVTIETVWGHGYRIVRSDAEVCSSASSTASIFSLPLSQARA